MDTIGAIDPFSRMQIDPASGVRIGTNDIFKMSPFNYVNESELIARREALIGNKSGALEQKVSREIPATPSGAWLFLLSMAFIAVRKKWL